MRAKPKPKFAFQIVCTCLRCDWIWVTRKAKRPVECPSCRSRRWDEKP